MSKSDLERAKSALLGERTCVLCRGDSMLSSSSRGVLPLVKWIDDGEDLRGFCAADRVVGRAAALLYARMGVAAVYAPLMSEGARDVLCEHGIRAECDSTAAFIANRANTGPCPMEQAVYHISDPDEALSAIRKKLASMNAF